MERPATDRQDALLTEFFAIMEECKEHHRGEALRLARVQGIVAELQGLKGQVDAEQVAAEHQAILEGRDPREAKRDA